MGLICKRYLLTLNQRVVGSIPTAPTIDPERFFLICIRTAWSSWEVSWAFLFPFRACEWHFRRAPDHDADNGRQVSNARPASYGP